MKDKKTFIILIISIILMIIGSNSGEKKMPERQHYILECENAIKTKLQHPSTYNKDFLRDIVENKKVSIIFSAKNSYGLELKYQGICLFDDNFVISDINIQEIR